MSDLTQLYQDIILGHNKRPRNYGTLEDFSGKAEKNNPLCGDEVTVYWKAVDNQISDLRFTAQGCAISRASASIMTELLSGKSKKESVAIFDAFRALLEEESGASTEVVELGDLKALSGVRQYPSRIKCAFLPWQALLEEWA
ncbi:SUF system NifU family Fe-S cluster assembly protein [Opitutia bacterium ISCC 51]|nr:SUF system NifU family Fe-S cluster assembly protein [Opitutae bacterium ISCC 51]QXD28423.1 SUF system NifU family Fe-S cluster assembly protein [Opitutae bacterium ISCC 52]